MAVIPLRGDQYKYMMHDSNRRITATVVALAQVTPKTCFLTAVRMWAPGAAVPLLSTKTSRLWLHQWVRQPRQIMRTLIWTR